MQKLTSSIVKQPSITTLVIRIWNESKFNLEMDQHNYWTPQKYIAWFNL